MESVSFFVKKERIDVMTEKELRKLNRYQLLELILIQSEQIQELEKQLEDTKAELKEQKIRIKNAGSIAEAALELSGVFEAAQQAADLYLKSIKEREERRLRRKDESSRKGQKKEESSKKRSRVPDDGNVKKRVRERTV